MNTRPIDEPTQAAIDALEDYIYLVEDLGAWKEAGLSFKEQSYAKSAAEELLDLLRQNRVVPPLIILENFAERMRKAHDASHNKFEDNVFFTSMQVADHIIASLTS